MSPAAAPAVSRMRQRRLWAVLFVAVLIPLVPVASSDHSQTASGKTVTFDHKTGNEWWVEVILRGPSAASVTKVEAKDDGGPWVTLTLRSWGAWAASFHIEPGHKVTFRATWSDATVTSCAFSHPAGVEDCGATPPPPPGPSPSSREAESFAIRTAGGRATSGAASGGAFWNLWSNGYIQDSLSASEPSDLVIRAGGTQAAGTWPIMAVAVDGNTIATQPLSWGTMSTYTFPGIAAGDHVIRISFTNDAVIGGQDRNLHLDVVSLVKPGTAPPPPPPPPGTATLVAGGLNFPVDISFGPDGTLYYAEVATGDFRAIAPGANTPSAPLGHVNALPGGNGGFLGLLVDKDFENTNAFYVYYSTQKADGSKENRVSRMVDGVETIILAGIPYGFEHDGGRLAWMGDHLLVTTGEAQDFAIPMDPNSLGGKTLRITTDGAAAPGNPTPGSRVYSMGHRNPFGIAYDAATNTIWQTENGPDVNDEINIIRPGKNYGWPVVSGKANHPSYENPEIAITPPIGPTGGTMLGGKFYFGSFNDASVYRVDGSAGSYSATRIWSLDWWHRVLDVEAGPDGALYVATRDAIYRLPVGGTAPPPDLPPLIPSAREAEAFASKSTGGKQTVSGASGGAIWNLWANGHIEDDMQSDGIHPLIVMAGGDAANGVWPHARVRIDGVLVWEFDATTKAIQAYQGPVPCQGVHKVRIEFTNDFYAPPADRNLLLDRVFFGDKPGDPAHAHPPENICD